MRSRIEAGSSLAGTADCVENGIVVVVEEVGDTGVGSGGSDVVIVGDIQSSWAGTCCCNCGWESCRKGFTFAARVVIRGLRGLMSLLPSPLSIDSVFLSQPVFGTSIFSGIFLEIPVSPEDTTKFLWDSKRVGTGGGVPEGFWAEAGFSSAAEG